MLAHHLRSEDAHAKAVLRRMQVPALQQQLLHEMQRREHPQVIKGAETGKQMFQQKKQKPSADATSTSQRTSRCLCVAWVCC